ncbi:hypothetical protein SUGI_0453980 [Cryptomeria japonica]|uniref:uncharacterized protein LOC131057369 n=1 Tax=Cryptomeria japonica TaxID=3369 RepID=UPI002408E82E|nr:uncharacterized protein LOC131057369 [Cryptomeria japonica]GLJ23890.1 hypothetical protein SUGI_0453980 [Cryptomeria japonica]
MSTANYKTPGEIVGKSYDYIAGPGTYLNNNTIYACVVGIRRVIPSPPKAEDKRPTVEVVKEKEHGPVPEPGAIITARITKVMVRMASADVICVGTRAVKEKFTGIVRHQDVRATEIDKVDLHTSFRPGDIVRAEVLSLGDARAYYLSTAKNELGVVSAESISGTTMVPLSLTEMQCPLTGQIERRKVAKVV